MSNLSAPPVPELSSERIAARQQHLVSELAAADRRPARQRWTSWPGCWRTPTATYPSATRSASWTR